MQDNTKKYVIIQLKAYALDHLELLHISVPVNHYLEVPKNFWALPKITA